MDLRVVARSDDAAVSALMKEPPESPGPSLSGRHSEERCRTQSARAVTLLPTLRVVRSKCLPSPSCPVHAAWLEQPEQTQGSLATLLGTRS